MAKLVEILARDWPLWKGGQRVYQDTDGRLIASDGYCFRTDLGVAETASDRETAVITKPKWAAERAAAQQGTTP
ncbi:hypothetical protein [Pantoea sp. 18069]|uniref:hypothetical protein n=1 Tax=Pantoea sp. 18069 TaxID=2681415 RepID=UPI0013593634|nr:hypothetical protein [Pantoea sp. 18069]